MNLFNRIFRRNMIECPRCLGKGHVNEEDIRRLKKELYWAPGKCAYCNGIGRVPPGRQEKVSVDFEYLTLDLPSWERYKVINADEEAHNRGKEFKESVLNLVEEIERLYYIENMEPDEIADHIFYVNRQHAVSQSEKQDFVNYVDKVIKSKLRH